MRESGVYTANIIIESKLLVAFLRSSQRLVDGIRAKTKKPKKFAMYQKKFQVRVRGVIFFRLALRSISSRP